MADDVYERIFQVAKRRGFLYPAFEIYGGGAGFYDYGPLGAALKANMESFFRHLYVAREGCAEINCPAVTPEEVFIASGHVAEFTDPMVRCTQCSQGFRADHLIEAAGFKGTVPNIDMAAVDALVGEHKVKCPNCGGSFGKAYRQNLMFGTEIGPGSKKQGYMRPETAQAMFVDFVHLYRFFREKLPFGVIQFGRGYRNEISPRQGMIRLREFNMMEVEVFVDPEEGKTHPRFDAIAGKAITLVPNATGKATSMTLGDAVARKMIANRALAYYIALTHEYLTGVGLDPARLRFRQHLKTEMAHYANDCWDAEFESARFGWVECVGIADRSAYDLTQHETHSGVPLRALRRYDTPKEVTRTGVFPITKVIGPRFKGDAKAVGDALKAVDAKTVQPGKPIKVKVGDKTVEVPPDAFEVKTVTEKMAGDSFTPHVIEPSYGLDRILYATLEHNFHEAETKDEETGEKTTYVRLRLPPRMSPVKVGVFPLVNKQNLPEIAADLDRRLREAGLNTQYDDTGSIGRRYARMDEIGTPFCVTVDFETVEEGPKKRTVTVRQRDSGEQVRVKMAGLVEWIRASVGA